MSIDVVIETTIARAPDDIYARIADVETWPEWLIASGIVSVTRTATGPVEAGERLTVEQRAAGRAGTFDAVIREARPPWRLALEGRDGDGVSIGIDASLTAGGAGSALRWSIRIGLPFRFRIFESMARPEIQRAAALDIERLRHDLEAAATGVD
jgi:Polyketide cyclase / dehydrase and lipid transport